MHIVLNIIYLVMLMKIKSFSSFANSQENVCASARSPRICHTQPPCFSIQVIVPKKYITKFRDLNSNSGTKSKQPTLRAYIEMPLLK